MSPVPLGPPDDLAKLLDELDEGDQWRAGAISLNDWSRVPWSDGLIGGITGKIAVVQAARVTGFEIEGGGHANWVVLVRGDQSVYVVPGCKVAGIHMGHFAASREFVGVP